jgi:DNA polymerase III subunit beta
MPQINVNDILPPVRTAAKIASGSRQPSLQAVWLHFTGESVLVRATDSQMDYTARVSLPSSATQDDLIIGVNGKTFAALLAKMGNGEIEISVKQGSEGSLCLLRQGRRKFELAAVESYWYSPGDAFPEGDGSFFISGDSLAAIIESVEYCVSTDDTLGALSCMLVDRDEDTESIVAVGLNGHQMAARRFDGSTVMSGLPEGGLKISRKFLTDLRTWIADKEIEAHATSSRIHLRDASRTEHLSIPLNQDKYPDWTKFTEKEGDGTDSIVAHRIPLITALERLKLFTSDASIGVWLEMEDQSMSMSATTSGAGSGEDYVPIVFSGDVNKIGLPLKDLVKILEHFSGEEVRLNFSGQEGPVFIRDQTGNDEYRVLIMPMKIQEETVYEPEDGQ